MMRWDKVKVALDFDETYTLRPSLWAKIIRLMLTEGWEIRFVTFRSESSPNNEDIEQESKTLGVPIIYCNHYQKRQITNSVGWTPDIWIDDMPELIPTAIELDNILKRVNKSDF